MTIMNKLLAILKRKGPLGADVMASALDANRKTVVDSLSKLRRRGYVCVVNILPNNQLIYAATNKKEIPSVTQYPGFMSHNVNIEHLENLVVKTHRNKQCE